jgi:nucleotide-binding universal stress UspA family protein
MSEKIVVGVDGSEHGRAALRWAVDEAKRRKARVVAVHAWSYPYVADLTYMLPNSLDRDMLARSATLVLRHSVEDVVTGRLASVPVEQVVAQGDAAEVLLGAAQDASLLVVGPRGRSAVGDLLLGSVSRECTRRAHCPVVVVPTASEREAAATAHR